MDRREFLAAMAAMPETLTFIGALAAVEPLRSRTVLSVPGFVTCAIVDLRAQQ